MDWHLTDAIGQSDVYMYSFDESLIEVTKSSEMDLCLKFWKADSNQVQSWYFMSSFLGRTRHLDLLAYFRDLNIRSKFIKTLPDICGWTKQEFKVS